MYTNFEGGARAEKTQFFGQNFGQFFQNFASGAENQKVWPEQGLNRS